MEADKKKHSDEQIKFLRQKEQHTQMMEREIEEMKREKEAQKIRQKNFYAEMKKFAAKEKKFGRKGLDKEAEIKIKSDNLSSEKQKFTSAKVELNKEKKDVAELKKKNDYMLSRLKTRKVIHNLVPFLDPIGSPVSTLLVMCV